jgi:hypothetical protein
MFSGVTRCIVRQLILDVSEDRSAFIVRVKQSKNKFSFVCLYIYMRDL